MSIRPSTLRAGLALPLTLILTACPRTSTEEGGDDIGETDESSGVTDEASDSSDSSDGETGDDNPATLEACEAACDVYTQCSQPLPGCVEGCLFSVADLSAECVSEWTQLYECIGGLTCEEFDQFVAGEPDPYPCAAVDAISRECTTNVFCSVTVIPSETDCNIRIKCPAEPVYSVDCTEAGCTCFIDGVESGTCDDPLGVCGDPISDTPQACCGFPL